MKLECDYIYIWIKKKKKKKVKYAKSLKQKVVKPRDKSWERRSGKGTYLERAKTRVWAPAELYQWLKNWPSSGYPAGDSLTGLVVKACASGVEDPGFESHLRQDFSGWSHTSDFKLGTPFWVESYQWLQNWYSSRCPARHMALEGQLWDWLARCQYTVTGWDTKLDLQLLYQCGSTYNCLCRSVPEIHSHVAGMLSN